MDIRDRIRAIIEEKKDELSVRSVSLAAGMSDSALGKFLKGETDSMTLRTVDKIAAALGVDAHWLAYGEGSPELATDVASTWNNIPEEDRDFALELLRRFARTGTHG